MESQEICRTQLNSWDLSILFRWVCRISRPALPFSFGSALKLCVILGLLFVDNSRLGTTVTFEMSCFGEVSISARQGFAEELMLSLLQKAGPSMESHGGHPETGHYFEE